MKRYLKAWRQNLAILATGVVVVVAVIVGVVLDRAGHVLAPGPGDNATRVEFAVTGTAPDGIAVSEATGGGGSNAMLLASMGRLPYRTSVDVGGSDFYEFQARLRGDGRIRCTVRIGSVVDVKRAAGRHAACSPAVSRNSSGAQLSGRGWHGD